MLRFHILFPVWGDPYIDLMVNIAIPTLLFQGNIPALRARHECKVVFFTRQGEEAKIRSAASVARLAEIAPIEFVHFDPNSERHAYMAMSKAHILGGIEAKKLGARMIMPCPDMAFSDGSLAYVGKLAEQGKSAVLYPGHRIIQETAAPAMERRLRSGTPIAARELVAFTLDHLHPITQTLYFDSQNFAEWPSICCWSVGRKGLLARCFQPHPLMVDFSRIGSMEVLKTQASDGSFISKGLSNWDDVHLETDSDNLHYFSFTPKNALYSYPLLRTRRANVGKLQRFAYGNPSFVDALHRSFFKKAVKMHCDDLDAEWSRVEEETAKIADDALIPPGPARLLTGRALNLAGRVKNAAARRIWAYTKPFRERKSEVSANAAGRSTYDA
jgi:hypothetical protein